MAYDEDISEAPRSPDVGEAGPTEAERLEAELAAEELREMGVDLHTDESEAEDSGW